jgi:uncharacterized protein
MSVGRRLVSPVPCVIGKPPDSVGGESVAFPSRSGSRIVGWLKEIEEADGSILLLHGIRADRRSMAQRAKFLCEEGYNTLCIDFRAQGESPGKHITMGYLEAMDAMSGVKFLRERFPGVPVGILGTSLGGAAALMADYIEPPEAFVVESVFADVVTGVGNRLEMRFGSGGRQLSPLLTWQIKPLLGIDVETLSPVRSAARIEQPVFVMYGSEDRRARPTEAEAKAIAGRIQESASNH